METTSPKVTIGELVKLCAIDNELFCRTFFPNAVRATSPSYMADVWKRLENPTSRLVNLRIFRGGFKTTTLRLFTAKRIAYGLSRTILYIGASEAHAIRSVQWLKGRIEPLRGSDGSEHPSFFASVFDLRPGKKWTENELEVFHGTDSRPAWVLGVGITGNIRGINFDDYRPDLIILDDIVTDENAITGEQREKLINLVLGAVKNSLASTVESPNAKMVLLQTPIHPDDVSSRAAADPAWSTAVYPCWTLETARASDLALQKSAWEAQFPTLVLRKDKQQAIDRNTLSIFSREMECRLVQQELRDFRNEWLRFYDDDRRDGLRGTFILGIDPVPPPSPRALAENMEGRDYEAQAVWCRNSTGYYLVDLRTNRGHDPGWSVATALSLASQYRVARIVVETIMYQRVLKWHMEKEMQRRKTFFLVKPFEDKRKKFNRITSVFGNLAPQGLVFVRRSDSGFIQQFEEYHGGDHDDILDASAIALSDLVSPSVELGADEYYFDDEDIPQLEVARGCP
jgi:predicted phage terminase large subunit-like protein